jgi:predicted nucleic acid-binding protein
MGTRFLLDTNTVIYYTNDNLPENAADFLDKQLSEGVFLSVISEIELLSWQFPSIETELVMQTFINECSIVKLTRSIVLKTIEIRKANKMKLPDAVIAATALVHDLTLISRNDGDFKRIADLKYINPYTDLP